MNNYDFNKEILRDIVNTDTLPADIIKILNDGKITTFYNIRARRGRHALPFLTLKLLYGHQRIFPQ